MTDEQLSKYLELNSKLQQKKNSLRKALKEKGVLAKGATNTFDKYSYFSEAQYKELFTELFSVYGLELKFTELDYTTFEGSEKQSNGRMPKLKITLFDIDTGFGEDTVITGEGIDKGDKAGYKAYTGALKYYLANTFMVATGDDPEKESPSNRMNTVTRECKASDKQVAMLKQRYTGENLTKLLAVNNISRIEEIHMNYKFIDVAWVVTTVGEDEQYLLLRIPYISGLKENDKVIVEFCGERQATILKIATLCIGDDKYNLIMAMAGDVQLQRIKAIVNTPDWSYDDDEEDEKEDE